MKVLPAAYVIYQVATYVNGFRAHTAELPREFHYPHSSLTQLITNTQRRY